MNLEIKRFQISKVGTHTDSRGAKHFFSSEKLQAVADEYNRRKAAKGKSAPLFIGHPSMLKTPPKPLGLVTELTFSDGKLYAEAYSTDELTDLIRRGVYKHCLASFDLLKGGGLKLNHVAFLNNPAVKGMDALEFDAGQAGYITFETEICQFSAPEYPSEAHRLDAYARAYMQEYPQADYAAAVRACLHLTNYR